VIYALAVPVVVGREISGVMNNAELAKGLLQPLEKLVGVVGEVKVTLAAMPKKLYNLVKKKLPSILV